MITFADSSTCYLIYASISPRILDLLPLLEGQHGGVVVLEA